MFTLHFISLQISTAKNDFWVFDVLTLKSVRCVEKDKVQFARDRRAPLITSGKLDTQSPPLSSLNPSILITGITLRHEIGGSSF